MDSENLVLPLRCFLSSRFSLVSCSILNKISRSHYFLWHFQFLSSLYFIYLQPKQSPGKHVEYYLWTPNLNQYLWFSWFLLIKNCRLVSVRAIMITWLGHCLTWKWIELQSRCSEVFHRVCFNEIFILSKTIWLIVSLITSVIELLSLGGLLEIH